MAKSPRTNRSRVSSAAVLAAALAAGLFAATPVLAGYKETVLNDGPVTYWRMNEAPGAPTVVDTADSTGSPQEGAQDGKYEGAPTFNEPGALVTSDPAVRFDPTDGTNDFGEISSARSGTTVPIDASFTVEVWARSATASFNEFGWFASSRQANGFIMHPKGGSTVWQGYAFDSGGNFHKIADHDVSAAGESIQEWHQYVMTYDAGSDTGVMYFDGSSVGTATNWLGGASRAGDNINVRLARDKNPDYGNGWLDEVAIYNSALSSAQIEDHFTAATTIPEPTSALLLAPAGLLLLRRRRRAA